MLVGWDDTPLRGAEGLVLSGANPLSFRRWFADAAPALLADVDAGATGGVAAAPVLIVVCADTEPSRRDRAVNDFGFQRAVEDWREAVASPDVDAVSCRP